MTKHTVFYYPYASFTNEQLLLLKVAALWFDKLGILDLASASMASNCLYEDVPRLEPRGGKDKTRTNQNYAEMQQARMENCI